jgi:DNA polymerase III subunit delta
MARRSAASATSATALGASTRICVLYGPEEMVKREHLDQLRLALAEAHGETETIIYDGLTATLADVLDELRTYSLMPVHKLVIVDHGEEFVKRFREAVERYAAAPVDQATLILRADTWNKGNLDKLIAKVGAIVKCEALTHGEAREWIARRAQAVHGRKLSPEAAGQLVQRLGADLLLLDSELGKVVLLAGDDQPVTPELVEQVVGRSSDEKAWAIQETVLAHLASGTRQNGGELLVKLHELVDLAGHDPVPITYALADLMRKLYLGAVLKRQGAGEQQIGRAVGLWNPQQQALLVKAIQRLGGPKLQRWFDRAVDLDRRGKSGHGEPLRNLECFCASLADEM